MRRLVWLLLLASPPAAANSQTVRPEVPVAVQEKWQAIRAHAEAQVRGQTVNPRAQSMAAEPSAKDEAARGTSVSAAADAVDPSVGNAAATVQRLAGAIKTGPVGTEAGLVIAPFVLADMSWGRGLELTFAALKADVTRLGGSYTFVRPESDADLWQAPPACDVDTAPLDEPREYFLTACTEVVPLLDPSNREVQAARISCGLDVPRPDQPAVASMVEALANIRAVVRWAARQSVTDPAVVRFDTRAHVAAAGIQVLSDEIESWTQPTRTSCYADSDVKGYFQQLYWDRGTRRLAVGAQWDLFPRKSGFSPDGSDLPRGETQAWQARVDLAYSKRGLELVAGMGIGESRAKLTDPLTKAVTVSGSVARAFTLLRSAPLRDDKGRLKSRGGELPPRLVIGLAASAEFAPDRPDSQETAVNKALVQPYLDFIVSNTLSFRLGIPVRAETAVLDAKAAVAPTATSPGSPAVLEKRALQWTVPVAIVAVLKM